MKLKFFLLAKLKKKKFYCNALAGNSVYNICVNSDMSVSCNCQDYDGAGRIGNLDKESLREIFSGAKASAMRLSLAKGKIPIPTCLRCIELNVIDEGLVQEALTNFSVPRKGIMVENTVCCNLSCLCCKRKLVESIRTKNKLSLLDLKKISGEIKINKIRQVCYFNLGEPFLSHNIYEELRILKEENPDLLITISTNGLLLDNDEKREACIKYVSEIIFSIDGVDNKTLQKYQRKGDFEKAYHNMKKLVEYRESRNLSNPAIVWKYVLFRWNDPKKYIDKAIELAKEAKVDIILFGPGGGSRRIISWRYLTGAFDKIGEKSLRGREIVLNPSVSAGSSSVRILS